MIHSSVTGTHYKLIGCSTLGAGSRSTAISPNPHCIPSLHLGEIFIAQLRTEDVRAASNLKELIQASATRSTESFIVTRS